MKIPKVIHRVWLKGIGGADDPPASMEVFWEGFARLYPGWELKTWDGSEFKWRFPEYYDASPCLAWKSDWFRYEVLQRYGGLYVDADIEPRGNAEHLFAHFDLFLAKQHWGAVSNAMMGSVPDAPLWERIFRKMTEHPAEHYRQRLGGMNMNATSQLSGPLKIGRPVYYDEEAAMIPSGLLLTNFQNRDKFPDALNHHHAVNQWRDEEAMAFYADQLDLEKKMDRWVQRGVGSVITVWLDTLGVEKPKGCGCKALATKMDAKGPDWCEQHSEYILDEMAKNAEKSLVPFFRPVGRLMLGRAISKVRKGKDGPR